MLPQPAFWRGNNEGLRLVTFSEHTELVSALS